MITDSLATIYARALLEAALEGGCLDEVLAHSIAFLETFRREREIRVFLESPRLERSRKREVLRGCLRGKVAELFLNFLCLMIDKGRQGHIAEALEAFQRLYDQKVGRVRARVTSAVPLGDDVLGSLQAALGARIGREVLLSARVEPEILGGLIVRYDGMVADGSLLAALKEARACMLAVKFGSELIHED